MKYNKREIGTIYENKACEYLSANGYEILERNFRCKMGEIDIIAQKGECIHFVEVKYRRGSNYGDPLEAVNYKKQCIISKVALFYTSKNKINEEIAVSFDVISILGEKIDFYENAFEYAEY